MIAPEVSRAPHQGRGGGPVRGPPPASAPPDLDEAAVAERMVRAEVLAPRYRTELLPPSGSANRARHHCGVVPGRARQEPRPQRRNVSTAPMGGLTAGKSRGPKTSAIAPRPLANASVMPDANRIWTPIRESLDSVT